MYILIRARKCRFLHTKSRPKPEFLPLVCFAIRCYFVINVRSCTPMSLLGWLLRLFQINHKNFKSQWLIENICKICSTCIIPTHFSPIFSRCTRIFFAALSGVWEKIYFSSSVLFSVFAVILYTFFTLSIYFSSVSVLLMLAVLAASFSWFSSGALPP